MQALVRVRDAKDGKQEYDDQRPKFCTWKLATSQTVDGESIVQRQERVGAKEPPANLAEVSSPVCDLIRMRRNKSVCLKVDYPWRTKRDYELGEVPGFDLVAENPRSPEDDQGIDELADNPDSVNPVSPRWIEAVS
jgi:hypothetical protein